ncbi:MAG: amino acid adenylation domain-containing protein [Propionibacteriales bacterium]|nr:amino acid adenylation domain-containing protein [Propionibacteriales bacterium]
MSSPPMSAVAVVPRDGTPASRPTIVAMLAAAVRERPDAPAVVDDEGVLTFEDLWRDAGILARRLLHAGVARGDCVGLFLEPGRSLVVSVWAVLRAGAVYVPLAVDYPTPRLQLMARDSGLRLVVTAPGLRARAESTLPACVGILTAGGGNGADVLTAATETGDGAEPEIGPDDRAYVIYTSGTTGRPKGVAIRHGGLVAQLDWLGRDHDLGPGARILLKTPTSFDAAQWELLAGATGATVVVAPQGAHRDLGALCTLVRRHQVTHLQCVPTVWSALVATPDFATCTSLTALFSGGEALTASLARELVRLQPSARLVNLYGPTETTINVTAHVVTATDLDAAGIVSIGRPVPGSWAVVLGEDGTPCPPGELGELCIGGVQLAVGYVGLDELTAERFPSIVLEGRSRRVYRTGDLVRRDATGLLEFHGRSDDQVKVNGHRIETLEVKTAIEAHHWVADAEVLPWVDPRTGACSLAAFVALDSDEAPLMDQGATGQHHLSKDDHTQVHAQLADPGVRHDLDAASGIALPGPDGRPEQRELAFRRTSYRTFEGGVVTLDHVLRLVQGERRALTGPRALADLVDLADLLRWFGAFDSEERLLPKYAYASPGALYATQVYVEVSGVRGLDDGVHYYHPRRHTLHRVGDGSLPSRAHRVDPAARVRLHLRGVRDAIRSVYAINVDEVLAFEVGHLLGLLDDVAAAHGRTVAVVDDAVPPAVGVVGDVCWTTVDLVVSTGAMAAVERPDPGVGPEGLDVLVQVHGQVVGLRPGLYRVRLGGTGAEPDPGPWLEPLGDEVVERRHVVAINQRSYAASAFAVALRCPRSAGLPGLRELGRALHRLQDNAVGIGLLSSGYSSLSGRELPAAARITELLPEDGDQLSYVALAGRVSEDQQRAEDMREDVVHMSGPQEILRDDLAAALPRYMVPSRVVVVPRMPISATGKVDRAALLAVLQDEATASRGEDRPPVGPVEQRIAACWTQVLGQDVLDVELDFFAAGGNSLAAVRLVHLVNDRLGAALPVHVLFTHGTVRQLAARVVEAEGDLAPTTPSRLVRLVDGDGPAVVLWPGLGGYPASLAPLARLVARGRPVVAVQTRGLNEGERPVDDIDELVASDLAEIEPLIPAGAPTFVGYSFGARVATDVAWTLAQRGVDVELVLLAPGSPLVPDAPDPAGEADFADPYFRAILWSVFLGRLPDPRLVAATRDRPGFERLLREQRPELEPGLAARIVDVVLATFGLRGAEAGHLRAVVERARVIDAEGDGWSFLDRLDLDLAPQRVSIPIDHYDVLRGPGVQVVADLLGEPALT